MLDIQSITTKHGRDILQGREKLTPRNNKSGKLDKDIKTVVINIATYSKRRSIIIRGEKKTWEEGEQIKTLKKWKIQFFRWKVMLGGINSRLDMREKNNSGFKDIVIEILQIIKEKRAEKIGMKCKSAVENKEYI